MPTEYKIQSYDKSLEKLFNDFYVVPDYQREFVWQAAQVEQLFGDVLSEYASRDGEHGAEYFVGSIVVCPGTGGVFELIDGQQRMTTAYLYLCAVRDHMDKHNLEEIGELPQMIASAGIDDFGRDVFRYRLELQYEDSADVLVRIADVTRDLGDVPMTRSVENIINAYRLILSMLEREFGTDERELRLFYSYFMRKVKLVRIEAPSVAHALKIFETINDRGMGLDAMDLLKNLMFMKADRSQFERLKGEWKKLVDILHGASEKPLRFLRYFIFAEYQVDRLRQDEIYDWLVKHESECGYGDDPVAFVKNLLAAAKTYALFLSGRDANGNRNRWLENLGYLSGSARQHLILLLAARHLDRACFSRLCQRLEDLFFAYIITREPTREFERKFAQWTGELKQVTDTSTLQSFLAARVEGAMRDLSDRFDLALLSLEATSNPKYRMRYLLGKLTQYVNEKAFPGEASQNQLSTFVNSKVDIEHILAQAPSAEALDEFDRPEEVDTYVQRLGNLTLAEKPLNASLGNRPFSLKRRVYLESKFLLTRTLGGTPEVGQNTSFDRAVRRLESFDTWTSTDIERRQRMLANLARDVWQMPRVNAGSASAQRPVGSE